MDLGIAGHAVDVQLVEIDHGCGLAQPLMGRERIGEEFERERIDVEMRDGRPCRCSHRDLPRFDLVNTGRMSIAPEQFRSDDLRNEQPAPPPKAPPAETGRSRRRH
jgi:hypothetical protein